MITSEKLQNAAVQADTLTDRQRTVATLVGEYYAVARELPSAGWLSRRLGISRQRALHHLDTLRSRGWFKH